jgi:hypothetical protein
VIPSALRPLDTQLPRAGSFYPPVFLARGPSVKRWVLPEGEVRRLVEPDVQDRMAGEDWERITLLLVDYALFKVRRLKWRTGDQESLPEGKTAEDLAYEAIEKVLSGARKWDPATCPELVGYLKGVVDSLVSHLVISEEHRRVRRMPQTEEGQEVEELLTLAKPGAETAEHLVTIQIDPEAQTAGKMEAERFVGEIFEGIAGDKELEMVMDALLRGNVKPREIAAETGIDVERIYKLREKLDRTVRHVERRLRN